MTDVVKEQILKVRDTGLTNMFDVRTVSEIAEMMGLYDLVEYLSDHRGEYAKFILTGKTEE